VRHFENYEKAPPMKFVPIICGADLGEAVCDELAKFTFGVAPTFVRGTT
jgi:hypothetical protein